MHVLVAEWMEMSPLHATSLGGWEHLLYLVVLRQGVGLFPDKKQQIFISFILLLNLHLPVMCVSTQELMDHV